MASYQDLETRIGILERKVSMLMNLAQVTKRTPSTLMPGEFVETQMSLNDLYRELSNEGSELVNV